MADPKRRNQNLPEGADGDLFDRLLADLRGLVWASQRNSDWETFARKANLSPSTVQNFAYGETQCPMFTTIFKLALALKRVDLLMDLFKEEGVRSVSRKQAKQRTRKKK